MTKKEYIERDEAKRVMKANDWLNPAIPNVVNVILDRLPAADVVEVVRCMDCTWWEVRSHGSMVGRCQNPINGLVSEYCDDEDYCSYGKRKEHQ